MNKLLFTFLFVLVGTLAQAQGHTSTNDGTPGSADNHEAAATSGHRVNAAKGTGKLTVIDATQGGLRVFSGDGTGRGNWVSGSSSTVVSGSLPANWVTLTRHNFLPRFVYAGMSITLTPGNWLVYVNATYLNNFNRGMNVWWDLSTSTTTNTRLGRALSGAAPTGSFMPVTATYAVQPTTTTIYYVWVAAGAASTADVTGAALYYGQGRIYALPVS